MRLYRRGSVWWVYFLARNGERIRRSTRQTDRKRADVVARDIERRHGDPTYSATDDATLSGAITALLADREAKGRAAETIAFYKVKAGHLVRLLPDHLASVTARAVDDYVTARRKEGASRHTIHKELVTLRGALKVARRRGEYALDVAQVMPVGYATGYVPLKRFLSESDALRLFDALPADVAAWVAFVILTGARRSEATRARVEDVSAASVHVRGTKTSKSQRDVPILSVTRWLADIVAAAAPPAGRLLPTYGRVRPIFWRALEKLGIGHLSPNDLRRSLATWLRVRGLEPHLIGSMLGHADGRMVERVYGRMPRGALGPLVEARLAAVHPVYTTPENQGDQEDEGDAEMQEETVPRDRIELPTRGFSIHDEGPCLYAFRSDLVAIVHPVYTRLRKAVRSLQQSPDYAALAHAELAALRGGAS